MTLTDPLHPLYPIGTWVKARGQSYEARGVVVAAFYKWTADLQEWSHGKRYVVQLENPAGFLLIKNHDELTPE